MNSIQSKLFDSEGYIPAKEYVESIYDMLHGGPWKLPLKVGDRIHLFLLSLFLKISWFSERLFIEHTQPYSPAYSLLLSYLKKNAFLDDVKMRIQPRRGYFSFIVRKSIEVQGEVVTLQGQGIAKDKATALSIALGETMERVITGWYDEREISFRSTPRDLLEKKISIVYPPLFHRFLDIQKEKFPPLRASPMDTQISWLEAQNVRTGEATYVPKKMTAWLKGRKDSNIVFVHATTNGSAGYFSKQEALLRALLEVVQRDGFLVHWLTYTTPEIIESKSLPPSLSDSLKEIEKEGLVTYLLNVTSLGIPTVILVGIGQSITNKPQICISAGCALTFNEAIEAAIQESGIVFDILNYPHEIENTDQAEPFISNWDKMTRQIYWRGEEKVKKFEWFISGEKVSFEELKKRDLQHDGTAESKISACLSSLKTYGPGYDPVVYYPLNQIQPRIGFYTAQVFIPKAFPFYLFEGYGTFDSDRLREFISTKGGKEFKLNGEPHMFS